MFENSNLYVDIYEKTYLELNVLFPKIHFNTNLLTPPKAL